MNVPPPIDERRTIRVSASNTGDAGYARREDSAGVVNYMDATCRPVPTYARVDRDARPDFGDQVDFRHACYAGVADLFVSNDGRMREILTTMVVDRRAEVLSPDEFLRA